MLNAASVLPAGPGERDDDNVFPLRERLRFRDNLGLGLRDVRQRPVFATLARGPWLVFVTIACFWQSNAEAWPSQETIARFSGYSSRAVRDFVAVLEQRGVVRLRRERRPDGSDRIYYAPGLVTLVELAAFVERFPRERAKALRPQAPPAAAPPEAPPTIAHPPETAAAAPPEEASMEHRDQDQKEPSSCEAAPAKAPLVREEEKSEVTDEDREVARAALVERMARKHPKRTAPRWFDAGELALVAACASALEGDREAKRVAMSDAIAGAFIASKEGPPTVRFVWEKLDHFLDHVDRGRRRRLAEERNARMRANADQRERVAPLPVPPAALSHAQMEADIAKLFGPNWRKHVPG
jgi:hypothetical protein